jgi:formylglycine-generating enzyme required for sulfatase activity
MGAEWERTAFKGADRPVERVRWDDAQDFFQKLNEWYRGSEGGYENHPGHFCLPTEAQWEYAAWGGRYGYFFVYPFSGSNRLEEVGWYEENSHWETKPVGRKLPNALGLYDMSGNVFEWCADWYGDYSAEPQTDPAGPDSGSLRVCRGGSWDFSAGICRVADRGSAEPDFRDDRLGFRAAFVPQSGLAGGHSFGEGERAGGGSR